MASLLSPIHRWVWSDAKRRAHNLLRFAEVEADGGRDLVRAAEVTSDPTLRRLFLIHAADEQRHAELFRRRGLDLLKTLPSEVRQGVKADWLAPGERGLDDVRVDGQGAGTLLAFLHLSEKMAARDFENYIKVLDADPPTRAVFEKVVRDEAFHMKYTHAQLVRVAPKRHGWLLWRARLGRLWKLYLRLASALSELIGAVVLTLQYFVLLPPFALMAKRSAGREAAGWTTVDPARGGSLDRQY